jgi:hypothetical protein
MKLPSKKQWPDYYVFTKHPISLDDVQTNLIASRYSSLEEVKDDIDLCFRNAKK